MIDLTTNYLGLQLKNPLVASASPLSKKVDSVRRMEDAGIAAVVMFSLFEEQIIHESLALNYFLNQGTYSNPEATSYLPDLDHYNIGPESYLELIQKIKAAVEIPVIGSLNGITLSGWIDYAQKIEEAGADGLELNLYTVPTDLEISAGELEKSYIELIHEIRGKINIPLAIKLSPYYTSLPHFANHCVKAGANGLVLFNRFIQPDLDIETLDVTPNHKLSTSAELRLPLRWIAILYSRLNVDFALTSGVHTATDILKAVMAGANVAMMASELIEKGPGCAVQILEEMLKWMEEYKYESIQQMRGSMSQKSVEKPDVFERGNYMKALTSYDNRI
jgi:dihydroorotate dehydrogenase (fumarate)